MSREEEEPGRRPIASGSPVGSAASAIAAGVEGSSFELREEESLASIQPVGIGMGRGLTCGLVVALHRCGLHRVHNPEFSLHKDKLLLEDGQVVRVKEDEHIV